MFNLMYLGEIGVVVANRYIFCGVFSLVVHSFIISAKAVDEPIRLTSKETGIALNIQFSAPSKPVTKPIPEPKPKAEKPPAPPKKPQVQPKVKKRKPKPVKPLEAEPTQVVKTEVKKRKKPPVEKKQIVTPEPELEAVNLAQTAARPKLVESPKFSAKPTPIRYPRIARKKGLQGQVIVEVSIDTQGRQIDRILQQSSGYQLLDKTALETIASWKFSAYQHDGIAIAHRVRIPVNFKLD